MRLGFEATRPFQNKKEAKFLLFLLELDVNDMLFLQIRQKIQLQRCEVERSKQNLSKNPNLCYPSVFQDDLRTKKRFQNK